MKNAPAVSPVRFGRGCLARAVADAPGQELRCDLGDPFALKAGGVEGSLVRV